jgi:hypothetical protein
LSAVLDPSAAPRAESLGRSAQKPAAKKVGRPRSRETRFSRWIDEHRGGDRKAVAADLGIRISHTNSLARGERTPSPELALQIVELSGKKLSLEDLFDPTKRFLDASAT